MFKTNKIYVSWKYLLTLVLLVSTHVSQAGTVFYKDAIAVHSNDKIQIDHSQNLLLSSSPITLESSTIYEDARLVSGDSQTHIGYFNQSVNLNQAGTYQATLSDFDFPSSFDMLGLTVTSSTEKMGQIWNSGSFNFNADAGNYFLGLVYKTDETLNVGMYGIKLSYLDHAGASAVPLPSALWLMLTGVMAIAGYRRKKSYVVRHLPLV